MCTSFLQEHINKLKTKHQLIIGILGIIGVNMFLIIVMIILSVFMLSNSAYKDVLNFFDKQDFDQMTFFSLATESAKMHINELTRNTVQVIANFRKHLRNSEGLGNISSNIVDIKSNLVVHIDDRSELLDQIVYFSPSKTKKDLLADQKFLKEINYMRQLYPFLVLYRNSNIFNFNLNGGPFNRITNFESVIIPLYDLDVIFYMNSANQTSTINKSIDLSDLKDYFILKFNEEISNIEYFSEIFPNPNYNLNSAEASRKLIYEFPILLEKGHYPDFYVSKITNNELYKYSNTEFRIQVFSNIFYDEKVEIEDSEDFEKFNETVIMTSPKGIDMFTDFMSLIIKTNLNIITEPFYPYKLLTPFQCVVLNYAADFEDKYLQFNPMYVADCFDNKTRIYNQNSHYYGKSDKYEFFNILGLFEDQDIIITKNIKSVIEEMQYMRAVNSYATYYGSLSRRVELKNVMHKIVKTYIPFTTFRLFNYIYPVSSIFSNFAIKHEGFLENNKRYLYMKTIGSFIISFVVNLAVSYIIIYFVIWNIIKTIKIIQEPLEELTEATNNLSNKTVFEKKRNELEKYVNSTKPEEYIDECAELIDIALQLLDGSLDFKPDFTNDEKLRVKLEQEDFNREFYLVKTNNLVYDENKILKGLDENNYLNQIIRIEFDKAKIADEVVKKCHIFNKVYDNFRNSIKSKKPLMNSVVVEIPEQKLKLKFEPLPFTTTYANVKTKRSFIFTQDPYLEDQEEEENFDINQKVSDEYIMENEYRIRDWYIERFLNRKENFLYKEYEKSFSLFKIKDLNNNDD
jgi:hypothetical protein